MPTSAFEVNAEAYVWRKRHHRGRTLSVCQPVATPSRWRHARRPGQAGPLSSEEGL